MTFGGRVLQLLLGNMYNPAMILKIRFFIFYFLFFIFVMWCLAGIYCGYCVW